MTDEERAQFGAKLEEFWPAISEPTGMRILSECERFGLAVVEQAMTELRGAMPPHHRMVDADRLLAVCRRVAGESISEAEHAAKKSQAYMFAMRRNDAEVKAENERLKQLASAAPADLEQQAIDRAVAKFPNMEKHFRTKGKNSLLIRSFMDEISRAAG